MLTALLLDPEREFSVSDLADISETSVPTAVREVDRAEEAGIVHSRNVGRTRLVTANTHSFAYEPLRELLLRAFGPLAVVTHEFAGLDGVDKLFIFGSWAARYAGDSGREPRDVDVLIVGAPDRGSAYDAAERAERRLHRPVQVTIRTVEQWEEPGSDPFLLEVQRRPIVEIDRDAVSAVS